MLVLTRRRSQEIVIDENIRITVVAVSGNSVRLGITAPIGVRVDRKEVRDRAEERVGPELVIECGEAAPAGA
jgi:carbon storage regulator